MPAPSPEGANHFFPWQPAGRSGSSFLRAFLEVDLSLLCVLGTVRFAEMLRTTCSPGIPLVVVERGSPVVGQEEEPINTLLASAFPSHEVNSLPHAESLYNRVDQQVEPMEAVIALR